MKFGPSAFTTLAVMAFTSSLLATHSHAQTYPVYSDYSFAGTDGANPRGALVQAQDGTFYGATYSGGDSNTGTIFKITVDHQFVTLHSFGAFGTTTNNNADGGRPNAALIEGPDGNLYGTTAEGGATGDGTIFRVTPDGQFATFFSFNDRGAGGTGRNVLNPLIVGNDGAFYGTAYDGGQDGLGAVFRVSLDGAYSRLASFFSTDGSSPLGALVDGNDGFLYGTTSSSAANNNGTVYKVAKDGSGITTLHVFGALGSNSVNGDGGRPFAGLVLGADGTLYGTTSTGGTGGYGVVFRITTDGNSFGVLHNFQSGDGNGRQPEAALLSTGDGIFVGTTSTGGANGRGTVFAVNADGQFATLASLDGANTGDNVPGNVILGQDGQLYGMAMAGGANNKGTIFEVDLMAATTPPPAATTPVVTMETTVNQTEVDFAPAIVTVSIPEALDHDLLVFYTVKGSAINGTDYTHLKGKVRIKAGKTGKQIKVIGMGDLEGSSKKLLKITLADDPDGNYEVGTTSTLKVKIYPHYED